MAAQVLSGENNLSYTNTTGQNVRLVINYLKIKDSISGTPTLSFPGSSITLIGNTAYGKTLGFNQTAGTSSNVASGASRGDGGSDTIPSIPLEIALSNGDTFSINSSTATDIEGYNIIIIPEAG